jgi:hypothetical protein
MKQTLRNNLSSGKFLHKVRLVTSVFSLDKVKAFSIIFFKMLPLMVVYSSRKFRVTPRLRQLSRFFYMIIELHVNHGSLYTVKYLRACYVAVQKSVAGDPVRSLHLIEPGFPWKRLKGGLPSFIPHHEREQIRLGNPNIVRLWLTMLCIFRILEAPRKIKLETITDPFRGSWACIGNLMYSAALTSVLVKTQNKGLFLTKNLTATKLRGSSKAGPNGPHSFAFFLSDALAFTRYPVLHSAMKRWMKITKSEKIMHLFDQAISLGTEAHTYEKRDAAAFRRYGGPEAPNDFLVYPQVFDEYDTIVTPRGPKFTKVTHQGCFHDLELGRLVGLPEPAGKTRIIAICDAWTQTVFQPLHKVLFRFLARLPNDGTFDQTRSYERAVQKGLESKGTYCADLSSATDRLPLDLQIHILNTLFGEPFGTVWGTLLRERKFILREPLGSHPAHTLISYGTGQPMGCLSSWAMLAVCHHYILQACHYNLGYSEHVWHTSYEILGDDIVIFDHDIYHEYLRVMELLNVETNPTKSLVSESDNKVLEFAKRTSVNGVDVSGISWAMMITASAGWKGVAPLIMHLGDRGLISSVGELVRAITRKRSGRFLKQSSRLYKTALNISVSLLNHYSNIGLMSLRSAFAYVVDPRIAVEQPISGYVPMTTLLHDLLIMIKSMPLFRETAWFDRSQLRLDDLLYRDYLVGANLLPFWGHGLDMQMFGKLNQFIDNLPHFPNRILEKLTSHRFPEDMTTWTSFEVRFYGYLLDMSTSIAYGDSNDHDRLDDLRAQFERSLHKRDFETTLLIHDELTLFLTKYDYLKVLGQTKAVNSFDKIPSPMSDVRLARDQSAEFNKMKDLGSFAYLNPDGDDLLTVSPWMLSIPNRKSKKQFLDAMKHREATLVSEAKRQNKDWILDDPEFFAIISEIHQESQRQNS